MVMLKHIRIFGTGMVSGVLALTLAGCLPAAQSPIAPVTFSSAIMAGNAVPPGAPTGFAAVPGNSKVTLTWTAVAGATSYNLYWSTTTGVTPATGTQISGVSSPYVHTGLTNGTTYYYVVTASTGALEGPASAEASATPVLVCLRLYVTSQGYVPGSDFNSAAGADAACNSDPGKPNASIYRAVIVDSSSRSAIPANNWVLYPGQPYCKSDGLTPVMTTSAAGIFSFGVLSNSVSAFITQHWTGLNGDWTTNANTCNDWTTNSIAVGGMCGDGSSTSAGLLNGRPGVTCGQSGTGQQLLCAEQ